jgi:hypothetical protein
MTTRSSSNASIAISWLSVDPGGPYKLKNDHGVREENDWASEAARGQVMKRLRSDP